jgi:RimJ/RimL family protein N-acetyltransferase
MYRGDLVKLRDYRREEMPKVKELINNPDIKKFLTPMVPFPFTTEDEYKWYDSNSALKDTYTFAIETLEDGMLLGGCGVNSIDWKNSHATLGIFIGEIDYLGKGYGTDAFKTLIRFVFDEMNVNKVKLDVYSFNERAIKSYEKCGFKKDGILREELFREGKYHDIISMSILRKEYESKLNRLS